MTYGAGGSTRDRTHACVRRLVDETGLQPAAHLTCVAASRAEVDGVVEAYAEAGISHIVALRGDMPDMGGFEPHAEGYKGSVELVEAISARGGFDITVSAYPEKHPESRSLEDDIDLLKAKIDAGATRAITQFVFDTPAHLRFRDAVAAAGISIPSSPALCRRRISPVPAVWLRHVVRLFPTGCRRLMKGWMMTLRRANILPHRLRPTMSYANQ